VSLGGTVEIARVDSVADASKLVLLSSFDVQNEERMGDLRNTQMIAQMMTGFPVVRGDYIISLSMGAGWEVFEVLDVQMSSAGSSETAALITPKTEIEAVRDRPSGYEPSAGSSPRRAYPLFVIAFQETIRKIDNDNIFLVMSFHGLHRDGRLGGEIQRKIAIDTDVQSLASRIKATAEKTADLINEESRNKTISPNDVRNRIIQSVLSI